LELAKAMVGMSKPGLVIACANDGRLVVSLSTDVTSTADGRLLTERRQRGSGRQTADCRLNDDSARLIHDRRLRRVRLGSPGGGPCRIQAAHVEFAPFLG